MRIKKGSRLEHAGLKNDATIQDSLARGANPVQGAPSFPVQERDRLIELYRSMTQKMITFDLTGKCNLKCVMCVWHRETSRSRSKDEKRDLDFDVVRKTIHSITSHQIKYDCINLSVSGEPTMHPQFREIMEFLFKENAGERLFRILSINTNMIPLDEGRIDFLLELLEKHPGNLFLTCSLNSVSREVGLLVKKKDFSARIESQMKYLILRKKELGFTHRLKLDLQLLLLKENFHEAGDFVRLWGSHFADLQMPYEVVPNQFSDCDNVINLKREFDAPRQEECDQRFYEVIKSLGLETEIGRKVAEKAKHEVAT